jgi:hypothetical protein
VLTLNICLVLLGPSVQIGRKNGQKSSKKKISNLALILKANILNKIKVALF